MTTPNERGTSAGASRTLVPLLLFIGLVTAVISSLGAPLLPLIARHYNVSLGQVQWSLTATVLVGAVTAPVVGRLSDGPHRRRVILVCLFGVVLGSVLVAATANFPLLIVGRGLQGLGLGLVAPCMATARDRLSEHQAHTAIASLSIIAPVGVGLGYPLSAWLAQSAGLGAAFWFGAAVSGLAFVLSVGLLPEGTPRAPVAINGVSVVTLSVGLVGVLVALSEGGRWGWSSPALMVSLIAGCISLAIWVIREVRTSTPLLNIRLLRNPSVRAADVTVLVMGAAMYTLMSAMTDFIQTPRSAGFGFGATAMTAGLLLLPSSIVMLGANRARQWLERYLSDRWMVSIGTVIVAASAALFAVLHSGLWTAFLAQTVSGVGLGLSFAALPGLIVRNVPPEESGSALGLYTVVRFVGYSLGSALSAALLDVFTPAGAHNPTERGYVVVLLASMVLSLVAAALTVLALRPARPATVQAPAVEDAPALG
jgi:MFS family permease